MASNLQTKEEFYNQLFWLVEDEENEKYRQLSRDSNKEKTRKLQFPTCKIESPIEDTKQQSEDPPQTSPSKTKKKLGEVSVMVLPLGKRGALDSKIEMQLVEWMRGQQEPLTSSIIRSKAVELFSAKYPSFKASRGWYYNFIKRNKLRRIYS